MPGVQTHLEQARHNEAFLQRIDSDTYSDWVVTVLFYAALHYVDAYLAKQGHADPGDHDTRDDLIRQFADTRLVWREYSRLKSFSRSSRYYGARFRKADITGLQRGSFDALKQEILRHVP